MKKFIKSPRMISAATGYDEHIAAMKEAPAYRTLKAEAAKYGYELGEAYLEGGKRILISIRPAADSYHPELYFEAKSRHFRSPSVGDIRVKLQTTAYGSMPTEQYSEYLDNLQDGYALAQFLETWEGWSGLYNYVED